jgi:hypothetical protein
MEVLTCSTIGGHILQASSSEAQLAPCNVGRIPARALSPKNRTSAISALVAVFLAIGGGRTFAHTLRVAAQENQQAAPPAVWFAPNMGSADYAELFTAPDAWSATRARIGVFKFYTQNLRDAPCTICGNNTLQTFIAVDAFRKLTKWGIAIAVEVPAVKPWGCGAKEANVVVSMLQVVARNGGDVAFLSMDEPLAGSQLLGPDAGHGCGFARDQTTAAVVRYGQDIHARFPRIRIGEIEPYPFYSVEQLGEWVDSLRRAGFNPAFFHLDVDRNAVRVHHQDVVRDLKWLSQFFAKRKIPFGVILWSPAKSDREFYESTLEWARLVKSVLGKPDEIIFQNWAGVADAPHDIPTNMPTNDATFSHMRVIDEALGVFNR